MIGINSYLSSLKSNVKSVQRGIYSGAGGTITIAAVNASKSIIFSKSKSSAGYVAATGTASGSLNYGTFGGSQYTVYPTGGYNYGGPQPAGTAGNSSTTVGYVNAPSVSTSLSGGSTSLTTKQYSAVLTNSTTITCDGPVEWQVIEYT